MCHLAQLVLPTVYNSPIYTSILHARTAIGAVLAPWYVLVEKLGDTDSDVFYSAIVA